MERADKWKRETDKQHQT